MFSLHKGPLVDTLLHQVRRKKWKKKKKNDTKSQNNTLIHPGIQSKLSPSEARWCILPTAGSLDRVPWPSNSSKETDLDRVQQKYGPGHLQPRLSQCPRPSKLKLTHSISSTWYFHCVSSSHRHLISGPAAPWQSPLFENLIGFFSPSCWFFQEL